MAIIEITYEAKCKHCGHFVRKKEGRRTVSRCSRSGRDVLKDVTPDGVPVTLKTRACREYKF